MVKRYSVSSLVNEKEIELSLLLYHFNKALGLTKNAKNKLILNRLKNN